MEEKSVVTMTYQTPCGELLLGTCKSSKDHSKPRNEADTSLKSPVNRGFFLATQWVYMI